MPAAIALLAAACAAPVDEEETAESSSEMKCASAAARKLVQIASKMDGQKSKGLCYRYVKAHLRGAGMSTSEVEGKGFGASAFQFAVWAKQNPQGLAKMGLRKATVGLDSLPQGAVIVWGRGVCGYNAKHGHIEVVIDENSSRACSDFCGRVKKGCGTPDIFVPTGCTSTQPDEADDEDDSIQAKPSENDDDDDTTRDAPTGSSEGSCWSATLEKQMPANACVQSESTSLWYQCNDGKWYRGVEGGRGRFGQCTSRTGL